MLAPMEEIAGEIMVMALGPAMSRLGVFSVSEEELWEVVQDQQRQKS